MITIKDCDNCTKKAMCLWYADNQPECKKNCEAWENYELERECNR